MNREAKLPDDILATLERYCNNRCPERAVVLLEELALRSQRAEDHVDRSIYACLLRHWHGIDRKRRDTPPLTLLTTHVETTQDAYGATRQSPLTTLPATSMRQPPSGQERSRSRGHLRLVYDATRRCRA